MTGPIAKLLPCGKRLHLQHGPIDLIIGADGDRDAAFTAARARFATVLFELVAEMPLLREPASNNRINVKGQIARIMANAAQPYAGTEFVTPMAAVAGSVAQAVLAAMVDAADLSRAYVNNGGDIALYVTGGHRLVTAINGHDGATLGWVKVTQNDLIRGIATSGRHGRSFSLGIADSVTVLARTAAQADVAATLIGNSVDLPGHKGIGRWPASLLDESSDLGDRRVVTRCDRLSADDVECALLSGLLRAERMVQNGQIMGAGLYLQGQRMTTRSARTVLLERPPLNA